MYTNAVGTHHLSSSIRGFSLSLSLCVFFLCVCVCVCVCVSLPPLSPDMAGVSFGRVN